jgi:hypothetical protein
MFKISSTILSLSILLNASTLQERDIWSDAVDKVQEEYDRIEEDVKEEFDRLKESASAEYDRIEEDVKEEADRVNEKYIDNDKLEIENSFDNIKDKFDSYEAEFREMRDEFKDLLSSQTLINICDKNDIGEKDCLDYIDTTRDFFVESLIASFKVADFTTSLLAPIEVPSLADALIDYSKREIEVEPQIEIAYENIIDDITINRGWKLISNPFNREVKLDEIFQGTLQENSIVSIFAYDEVDRKWQVCQANESCSETIQPFSGIWVNSAVDNNQLIFNRQ